MPSWLLGILVVVCMGAVPVLAARPQLARPSGDGVVDPKPGQDPKEQPGDPGEPPGDPGEPPGPDPRDAVVVTGTESLVWDQPPEPNGQDRPLHFVAHVDGEVRHLPEARCDLPADSPTYVCRAPLPSMTPGLHVLDVAAYFPGELRLEGPRSIPQWVWVQGGTDPAAGATAGGASSSGAPAPLATATDAGATLVAEGLEDATDLAVLPDGRLLVAERAGRLRVIRDGVLSGPPALSLDDVVTGDGRGLLALAVSPDFARTGALFLLYNAADGLRVARVTASADTFHSRAVIVDGLPAAAVHPRATMRVGPDGRLYVALDDGGDPGRASDLGSWSGKVLRFNPDGTTPDDQPSASPVHVSGLHAPVALAWVDATLWVADRGAAGDAQLLAARPDGPRPALTRHTFPSTFSPSAMVASAANPASGEPEGLLIGAGDARGVLRLDLEAGAITDSAWLMEDAAGSFRALAVAADGAVYACAQDGVWRIDADDRPSRIR